MTTRARASYLLKNRIKRPKTTWASDVLLDFLKSDSTTLVKSLLNYHPACKPQSPQTDRSVPKKEKYAMDEFDSVLSNHLDKAQHTMATNGQRENYDDANVKTQKKTTH